MKQKNKNNEEIESIKKLIEDVEWEFKNFERPSASNSKKMLEIIKNFVNKNKTI